MDDSEGNARFACQPEQMYHTQLTDTAAATTNGGRVELLAAGLPRTHPLNAALSSSKLQPHILTAAASKATVPPFKLPDSSLPRPLMRPVLPLLTAVM